MFFSKLKQDYTQKYYQLSVIKKNILISFFFRGFNFAIGYVTLPLALTFLSKYQYGVFATITSIIAWVDLFDFGLGQGLRNRLAEAISRKDYINARKLVSSAYVYVALIAICLIVLFLCTLPFISWRKVLNAEAISEWELMLTVAVSFVCFCLKFVTSLINKVYFALQKSMMVDVIQACFKIIYLVAIIILIQVSKPSLFNFAAMQSFLSFIIPLIGSFLFFSKYKPKITPSLKFFDKSLSDSIFGIGLRFFVIQFSFLIMYSANSVLIAQFADPTSVTNYQIIYTFLNITNFVFNIFITPFWSAYTEAFTINNYERIHKLFYKSIRVYFILSLFTILIVFVSPWVFQLWLGNKVQIPFSLTVMVACMILINSWVIVYNSIVNAVSKLKLQMYLSVFSAFICIPVSYFMAVSLGFGAKGVVAGSIIATLPLALFSPIQAFLIINKKDSGIFSK